MKSPRICKDCLESFKWLQDISSALSISETRPDDLDSMLTYIEKLHREKEAYRRENARLWKGLKVKL